MGRLAARAKHISNYLTGKLMSRYQFYLESFGEPEIEYTLSPGITTFAPAI